MPESTLQSDSIHSPHPPISRSASKMVQPTPAVVPLPTEPRFDAFDWVRVIAALAVVMLHACVPYLVRPMPGLIWTVRESTSPFVDGLFWSIELVVMPVFLIIAGFFAWRTLTRKGAGDLLRSRSKRLLRPLLFGAVVILPLDLYIWVLGFVGEGWVPAIKMRSLKFEPSIAQDFWGFGHLWFLHYLWSYVALLAGWSWVQQRFAATEWGHRRVLKQNRVVEKTRAILSLPRVIVATWIIGTVVLWFRPEVIWGFQHRFLPVPSKWIYNGLFFIVGSSLAHFDPRMVRWSSIRPVQLAGIACVMVATLGLGQWRLDSSSLHAASPQVAMVLALGTAASSLFGSLALISVALRLDGRFRRPTPLVVQYLAAASFWIYLVHHPLLGLIHIDLKWLGDALPPVGKMMIATVAAVALSIGIYEGLIRRSRLGRWLGFQWENPSYPMARTFPVFQDEREPNAREPEAPDRIEGQPNGQDRPSPIRRAA